MVFLAIILYILWDVILCVCAALFFWPILTVLFAIAAIIATINVILNIKKGKMEITSWNLASVGITALAGLSLWDKIAFKMAASGILPIITYLLCGVMLIVFYKARTGRKQSPPNKESVPFEQLPESVKKRIRTTRMVAIICTAMASIGALIVITKSADPGEALPPTVIFAVTAMICWALTGKKH